MKLLDFSSKPAPSSLEMFQKYSKAIRQAELSMGYPHAVVVYFDPAKLLRASFVVRKWRDKLELGLPPTRGISTK
jgi:hypothetical protein